MLYVEEERILGEFVNVKASIASSCMVDEDEFEAARETCLVLGGKLMEVGHCTGLRWTELVCAGAGPAGALLPG